MDKDKIGIDFGKTIADIYKSWWTKNQQYPNSLNYF